MANEPNSRNLRDALLQSTKALPAAAATNYSDSIDTQGPGPHRERMELEVLVPVLPILVDAKTVTFELEHSDDDSTFTDVGDFVLTNDDSATVTGAYTVVLTGSETPGTPGPVTFRFPIPSFAKRYIRVSQDVLTAGGDNTAATVTYTLLT
jgi:hypothetical protein